MMPAVSLSDLQKTLGGELTADANVGQVCTDSRAIKAGDLFVALSGENFNANQFVSQVAERQAAAAVVTERQDVELAQLVVADTQKALGQIAALQRDTFNGPLIALTGSAGKTSTKEMLANILLECGTVLATKGNLNNEIGVPLTLLELDASHQYAVIEMGAAKPADISYLCQFAKPNVALVTNALQAHLAGFGHQDVIAKTKGEIYQGLGEDGVAVINLDSRYAPQWLEQAGKAKILSFSLFDHNAYVYAQDIHELSRETHFTLCIGSQKTDVQLALLGRHNVANALAAAAAAWAVGASLEQIKSGLSKATAVSGRLNLIRVNRALTLIDDSYNANPDAVKVAVDVLAQSDEQNCLVLGAMAELGERERDLHEEVGAYARAKNVSHLVAIGQWANDVAEGYGKGALAFDDIESFKAAGLPYCQQGVVLVKGSRSSRMERVVDAIQTTFANGEKH